MDDLVPSLVLIDEGHLIGDSRRVGLAKLRRLEGLGYEVCPVHSSRIEGPCDYIGAHAEEVEALDRAYLCPLDHSPLLEWDDWVVRRALC